jgi:hypothetical protein
MTHRSSTSAYFAAGPATALRARALPIAAPDGNAGPPKPQRASFSRTVDEDLQALALYPDSGLANVDVHLEAIRPDGSHIDLIRFRPQPGWARRYWFDRPIALPRGSRIEAVATFADALLPPGAAPAKRAEASALGLTLNVIGK